MNNQEIIKKATIIALKIKVNNILESFKKFKSLGKQTKQGKKAIKLMEEFVRCNLSAPSIEEKYNKVLDLLKEFKNKSNEV